MLEVLTENLRHQDKRVRLASSECLGKIGALDPSYLPNNIIKEGIYNHLSIKIQCLMSFGNFSWGLYLPNTSKLSRQKPWSINCIILNITIL